ncbi:MAG: PTS sugar transporter subunit IIC, partial [Oscillospiraceae bacterium]|nr:PTS sugar transporter subunit IIC [Oscillospiraceae bacterium]
RIWIPPILTSAITGPVATCIFGLEMNGAAVSSGMGTCGFVGQIGVYTGWLNDIAMGTKTAVTAADWIAMLLICFVLPAVLSVIFCEFMKKRGWIKSEDMVLDL